MGKKEKLLKRLYSKPTDFKWSELRYLLSRLGYTEKQGKGSRVKFYLESPRNIICLHRPHPGEIIKTYVIDVIIDNLEATGVAHGND